MIFFQQTYILKRLENLSLLYLLIGLSNSFRGQTKFENYDKINLISILMNLLLKIS